MGEVPANCRSTRIRGGRCLVPGPRAAVAGQALDPGAAHQRPDRGPANLDAETGEELGVDAPGPVNAPGHQADGLNLLGQPCVPQRPG